MQRKVLILLLIIVVLAGLFLGYFFLGKQTAPKALENSEDLSNLPIKSDSIPSWSKYSRASVSFNHPEGYTVEEREKGYFVISNENKDLGEAEITVDTRRQGANAVFDQAAEAGRNNLTEQVEKDLPAGRQGFPNGIKMFGKIKDGANKGTPLLSAYLEYGQGAIVVETSGEILNEAVFDQVVSSIKFN